MKKEIITRFGKYIVENNGEFGGCLTTPGGKQFSGNFCEVIEVGGDVYAMESLGHMTILYFKLYYFTGPDQSECIYSAGQSAMEWFFTQEEAKEQLRMERFEIENDVLTIFLEGYRIVPSEETLTKEDYIPYEKVLEVCHGAVI